MTIRELHMKKYIYLTVAVLGMLFVSSCGRKLEFEHMSFATLLTNAYSVDENVGEVKIPVSIYNPTGKEVQVSVQAADGKARAGVDFEVVSPMSGILTFAPGEETQEVTIEIKEHADELTGTKDFTLAIASATEGFQVGNINTAQIKIKDLDHPLKDFIGVWTGSTTGYSGYSYTWDITVDGDESDPTYSNLIVTNLCPYTSMYGGLTPASGYNIFDAISNKEMTQMIVPNDQYIGSLDGEDLSLMGVDAPLLEQAKYYVDIVFELSQDKKTMVVPNAYGPAGAQGLWEVYPGGIVFTKK